MTPREFRVERPAFSERCVDCPSPCSDEDYIGQTASAMLAECRSFYYVYKKLEEKTRMPVFSNDWNTFLKENKSWAMEQNELPYLCLPKIVNGSLACEIALKYFLLKENGAISQIHRLDELFDALPLNHKKVLLEKIYKTLGQNKEMFDENIKRIANSFIDWRYAYEREVVSSTNFFDGFISIVCEYALTFSDFDGRLN